MGATAADDEGEILAEERFELRQTGTDDTDVDFDKPVCAEYQNAGHLPDGKGNDLRPDKLRSDGEGLIGVVGEFVQQNSPNDGNGTHANSHKAMS